MKEMNSIEENKEPIINLLNYAIYLTEKEEQEYKIEKENPKISIEDEI